MADTFRIIPYKVRSAGTDVPPEEVQAAVNSLAQQTTVALNSVASDPTGPAGGDLSGNYPNPTVSAVHATSGTLDNVPVGQITPAAGAFTTLSATTPLPIASGGTGASNAAAAAHALNLGTNDTPTFFGVTLNGSTAHSVVLGEGNGNPVSYTAVGSTGQMLLGVTGADPAFGNNPTITGGSINSAPIGQTTPAAGSFTTLTAATPMTVPSGGTGRSSLTAHGVLIGASSAAVNQTSAGTSGQPLLSGGAGADPNWGTLSPSFGGTGQTSLTAHAVLLGEGTANVAFAAPSTAGQALVSAGATSDPVFGFPTGALLNVQVITATQTYTATAGTNSVIVEVQAAGGGGGGVSATGAGQAALAQGGGAGSYVKARITSAFNGVTATIGAAGTGGAAGANAGGTGGTASFGALISCPGGTGGAGSAGQTAGFVQSGAGPTAAPTVSGVTVLINSAGQKAAPAASVSTGVVPSYGGYGFMGLGSDTGNGAGGDGAAIGASTGATAGQNGATGKIIVYEYA